MARVLSLYLPMWHVDLVRRRDRREKRREGRGAAKVGSGVREKSGRRGGGGRPPAILLVTTIGQRRIVERCCESALAAGVRAGMTLAHARALLPEGGVRVEELRAQQSEAALRSLAAWAVRYSPVVAPDPPDGLLMDVSGCERLYGGEEKIVAMVAEGVRRLGLRVRAAVAPTVGCAWAVARYGRSERAVVLEGEERAALAPLPVGALRIEPEAEAALEEVGVETVGEVMALPRSALPVRFGAGVLRRLDQALGAAPELIEPVRPVEPVRAEWVLSGPTTSLEAVCLVVRELVGRVCEELSRRESGALRLELVLSGPEMRPARVTASLSRGSRNPGHLWSLLRAQVERVHVADGVEEVSLTATRVCRLRHEQVERWVDGEGEGDGAFAGALGEFVDTLVGRLGAERVVAMEVAESHRPERVMRLRPWGEVGWDRRAGGGAAVTPGDRPSVLFERPEAVQAIALLPDGVPRWLRWRGMEHNLVDGVGPERIGGEWWRERGGERDYFRVRDERGAWLWVYREGERGWFVHGVWG